MLWKGRWRHLLIFGAALIIGLISGGYYLLNRGPDLPVDCPPSCAYANLQGRNLEGVNLSGANFIGANLTEINLRQANLSGATLMARLNKAPATAG